MLMQEQEVSVADRNYTEVFRDLNTVCLLHNMYGNMTLSLQIHYALCNYSSIIKLLTKGVKSGTDVDKNGNWFSNTTASLSSYGAFDDYITEICYLHTHA